MIRYVTVLLVFVSLLAIAFSRVSAGEQRPFKARGPESVVQEGPGGACGADRIDVQVEGSGQGTHVGQYTITRHHCFNPALATFEDGTFELTAANGDKIFGTYSGFVAGVVEVDDQGNPLVIIINATQVITGGTGRFADAEGQSDLYSEFNLITHRGNFTIEGWISY
ncbi:MAG TPA: hypothetical protein VF177_15190 [Anaerolineae bacterium]